MFVSDFTPTYRAFCEACCHSPILPAIQGPEAGGLQVQGQLDQLSDILFQITADRVQDIPCDGAFSYCEQDCRFQPRTWGGGVICSFLCGLLDLMSLSLPSHYPIPPTPKN